MATSVPIVQDEAVDPKFGSGAVMICTFGDKQDVHWWKQHNLPLRKAIDRRGMMTGISGKSTGLSTIECRKAILSDMKAAGILKKQEKLEQRVGTCWRCKTPIEILLRQARSSHFGSSGPKYGTPPTRWVKTGAHELFNGFILFYAPADLNRRLAAPAGPDALLQFFLLFENTGRFHVRKDRFPALDRGKAGVLPGNCRSSFPGGRWPS